MADVLRGNASFEETVAHLISSSHIREPYGEIGFTVVDEVQFLTFRLRQCGVYSTLLQVTEQCRVREFSHFQMLETRFGCLLAKRERYGTDVWCLFRYLAKQIRHMVGCVQYPCKCDDVTTSSQSIIEPQVAVGVHLERGFRFLTERGFIPQAVSLLLYGRITQTLQIVRNFDLFCFLDVHDIISMDLMMTVKTLI